MNEYNPFSLDGRTVLVTGASSGIGRAVAVECSRMGAVCIITGRNPQRLEETLSNLAGNGHSCIEAELTDEGELAKVAGEVPPLDGVVHCAGIADPLPFGFVSRERMSRIFAINFEAPVMLTQRLLKQKKLKRGSSVVFISSISGVFCSYVAGSMYSATKGAVNGMVKGMAIDLAPKGIRVNSVAPGMVGTDILVSGIITPEQLAEDAKRYPLGRYGRPEEVAWAVVYLLSGASSWTTGSCILLDGGYTLL